MDDISQRGGHDQEEEDVSLAFLNTMEDTVVEVRVEQGIPFVGRSGKQHPIYIVCLRGNQNERTRSFRFNTFREYHEGEVVPSPFKPTNKFPKTLAKSFMGLAMSAKEVNARCRTLDAYMHEVFARRDEWTPRLKNATLSLLKLDEENVFPAKVPATIKARLPPSVGQPKAKAGAPQSPKSPAPDSAKVASKKESASPAAAVAPPPPAPPTAGAGTGNEIDDTTVVVHVEVGSYAYVHKHRLDCCGNSNAASDSGASGAAVLKTFMIEVRAAATAAAATSSSQDKDASARMTFTPRFSSQRSSNNNRRKAPRQVIQVFSPTRQSSDGNIAITEAPQSPQLGPQPAAAHAHVPEMPSGSVDTSEMKEDTRKSVSLKTAKFPDGFLEALENGIKLVKFNRKGIAAFRVISMDASTAENTVLNWRPAEKEGFSAKLLRLGKSEGVDLKNLKAVRLGESPDPESPGKWGTATLRMYAQKSEHGTAMLQAGITFCLIFNERSLDLGADSVAQRDFLVNGFEALLLRGQVASIESPKAAADDE